MDPISRDSDAIDADLLRKTAAGDMEAFGQLYDRTSRVLFAIAGRILRDDVAAEDLLQDVYVQVWEKAVTFNPAMGRAITWLITLTRNRAIDRLRSSQRRDQLLETIQAEAAASDREAPASGPASGRESFADEERLRLVRDALRQLPVEQRLAIELAFFGGLSQSEIAAKLSAPLGTIKARIRRGMVQLRDVLAPFLSDETSMLPRSTASMK